MHDVSKTQPGTTSIPRLKFNVNNSSADSVRFQAALPMQFCPGNMLLHTP